MLCVFATRKTNRRHLLLANQYWQTEEHTTGTFGSPSWAPNPISIFISCTGKSSANYGLLKIFMKEKTKQKRVPRSKKLCKVWIEQPKDFTSAGHLRAFTLWEQCASCREEPAALPALVYSQDLAFAWYILVWLMFHKSPRKAALLSGAFTTFT